MAIELRRLFTVALLVAGVVAAVAPEVGAESGDGVLFSGYGEMHYNIPSDGTAELDFHRLVLGFATSLSENIGFHAELDFEHAFTEPEMEFAYLDIFYRETLSFRTGLMLMPVGPLNEYHEPPLFYSVERPYLQKTIIPTTWQEPGAGVVGAVAEGSLKYRAYVVGGLDASEFSGSDGIRSGRQHGAEAKAEDLAAVARVEYSPTLGTSIAASGYVGGASQDDGSLGDAVVSLGELDALVHVGPLELRAMGVAVFISDADSISAHNGTVVGERMVGFSGEVALHLLRLFEGGSDHDLVVFARGESFDTHDRVPDGLQRNPAYDRQVVTLGASFLPVPNVAFKADVELWQADDGSDWEQVNLGFGFMY
jgi:hypothetical protein